ncbi:unnamed protein product [Thlaspi arvense]|uniref:Carboxypeptidase n=1 Tax=Thlaspi arvense TaxID=13288 RepID=A0AAU9S349_THLAR|nr:unnamed protein product [Thlaspi arvense]
MDSDGMWRCAGPGCSSVAYGASEELGPFGSTKPFKSLSQQVFLEQSGKSSVSGITCRVGFSYTNTSSDLKDSGDKRTAQDALIFLIRWFSRFPQYKYRDFYIAGESYAGTLVLVHAGHYVPQLTKKIHDYNKQLSHPNINLKGFIVGNAVTDYHYDGIGTASYWWTHSMISDRTYKSILQHCNFAPQEKPTRLCDAAVDYAMNHEFGNVDPYSIYTPTCQRANNGSATLRRPVRLRNTLLRRRVAGYDPCTESYAEKYYNRPDVQRTLHANTTGIAYKWTACSDVLIKNWKDSKPSMLPTYEELMAAGLRIWVFSGDTDSVVPVTATRFSLNHLNLTVKTRWYPWYSGPQVGGWTEVYEGLTFATAKNYQSHNSLSWNIIQYYCHLAIAYI